MIKVVTLDLDGVYFLKGHENFKKNLAAKFGLSEDQIRDVYFKGDLMSDYKQGKIADHEFWVQAIQGWNIDTTQERILEILVKGYQLNPAIKELIHQLKKQGIKIAACTNNFPSRINALNKKFDFLKDFDIKVFSFKEGYLKPSTEIFQILIERSGVEPKEIFIADDSPEKLGPARELGIQVFPYTYFGQMLDDLVKLGVKLDKQKFTAQLKRSVSVGGIVINSKQQILLTRNFLGNWVLPKGHIELGETFNDTAFREVKEETGLSQIELIKEIPDYVLREAYEAGELKEEHYFVFNTDYTQELQPEDKGHLEAKWFNFDEAISVMAYEKQKEFIIKHKNFILNS